jgi:delta-aminolevulinic acid dehydratase/porphobilinogen synthase
MAVPIQRLRRLQQHEAFRRMVRETSLTLFDLLYPLFVVEGRDRREVIAKVMALPKADLQNEGQVLQSSISRHVAGIWSIWFLRSISFVWFDERERQDRPAHRMTTPESPSPHAPLSQFSSRRL